MTITARSWRAHTPSASKPAAASHRRWSSMVLGWSYTPSTGVTTSAGSSGTTTSRARTTARPEPVGDEDEHVRLTCALGQWVAETAHAKIGGYVCGQGSEHLRTLVDADQLRL